ncbi:hypothetical protein [Flavobacterium sp.]|uniref:hypothetical protein n=1 Tax=Flavobacterium sp. TaxID=239 RepID=UPI0039E5F01B
MEAKSTNRRTFQLLENEQILGELAYENLLFLKATITLGDATPYEIKPVGLFGTSITVTQNKTEIANLQMNWRGQIVFAFPNKQQLVLKPKGLLNNSYVIENSEKEILFQFHPRFNWSKFNCHFDITHYKEPEELLVVLLGVYASNYLIAAMAGTTAGMA